MPDVTLKHFKVDPGESGGRLDLFLAKHLSKMSRSQLQRMIERGFVKVGGKSSKAGHRVQTGEEIEIEFLPPKKADISAEPIPLDIIFEDSSILVLNKPAERVVHPAGRTQEGTLVNALLYHCKDLSGIGGVERPGIVHRLDKGTSGVLVVAKNDQAHQSLSGQFHGRTIGKNYLAFVWGTPRHLEGNIDAPLGRSEGDRKRISTKSRHTRSAVTHYKVLKSWGIISLVELKPLTGRTHQLRVHLASLGHPVVGDPTYGKGGRRFAALPEELEKWIGARRFQLLHAASLSLAHPLTRKPMVFEAPLRPEMLELREKLDRLKA